MVEKFESKKSKSTENAEEEDTLEKGKLVIAGKEESVTEEGYEEPSDKDTKEKDKEIDSKEKNKETDKEKPKDTGKKSIKESLLNYGEMKIFEGLRDNNYSLTDIKRMIREGEINEKMIEKFLARVEKMEDRVQSKADTKTTVEGFAGNNYANAYFH